MSYLAVCNFIVHEKCLKTVTLPCYSVAATLVKHPVAHVWTERTLIKGRKFCNVCRKKMEDVMGICCEGQSVHQLTRSSETNALFSRLNAFLGLSLND